MKKSTIAMVLVVILLAVSCSSNEPIRPSPTPGPEDSAGAPGEEETAESATSDNPAQEVGPEPTTLGDNGDGAADGDQADDPAQTDPVDPGQGGSTSSNDPPQLRDQDLAVIENLEAGQQVTDAQGNIIAIYGIRDWPASFDALSDASQGRFPFVNDVSALGERNRLVAIDVGICDAGIDSEGLGTAEFFAELDLEAPLGGTSSQNRALAVGHPVLQPGFGFPAAAECARGWLPVLRSGEEAPAVARYVLATRAPGDAEVERHVYQWSVSASAPGSNDTDNDDLPAGQVFQAGQTVTFNDSALVDSTVTVEGWAELIGAETGIEGTRMVAVSLSYCPASPLLPEFGLVVDGWGLVATTTSSDLLGGAVADDPSQSCFEGWLDFVVPFGGVPTAFFASDGADATNGYAEWSLENAALAAPQQ